MPKQVVGREVAKLVLGREVHSKLVLGREIASWSLVARQHKQALGRVSGNKERITTRNK